MEVFIVHQYLQTGSFVKHVCGEGVGLVVIQKRLRLTGTNSPNTKVSKSVEIHVLSMVLCPYTLRIFAKFFTIHHGKS